MHFSCCDLNLGCVKISSVARDILKVRKVGGTLVVTLTQAVLEQIPLEEGDRVLIEALPPRRILISREEISMPSTRRIELELQVLKARSASFDSQIAAAVAEYNTHSAIDGDELECFVRNMRGEQGKVDVTIAEKELELFELQGASA